jgi:outer membrane protein OmpA-like peptidoglycan-associated protein
MVEPPKAAVVAAAEPPRPAPTAAEIKASTVMAAPRAPNPAPALVPGGAVPSVAMAPPPPAPAPVPRAAAEPPKPAALPPAAENPPPAAPKVTEKPKAAESKASPRPEKPIQSAAVVKPPVPAAPDFFTVSFAGGGAKLPDASVAILTKLAERLRADESLQVQLNAYAEGDDSSSSKARRLSLQRAVAVRSFLADNGVRSTRMVVRALGNKVADGPADRVDVEVLGR